VALSTLPMLQDILDLPAFQGAEVLSGRLRLQQPVTWVHVSELLDVARLLSGGELLLSTGLELFRVESAAQIAYLQSLAEVGASGLILELVQWSETVPTELLQIAQRSGIPLIVFRSEVRFADLTRAAHQRILRPPALQESLMDCLAKALIETGRSETLVRQQLGALLSLPARPRRTLLTTLGTLLLTQFNIAEAARSLGVSRQSIWVRLF
jgi:DNA-binding PucR family transcriptional regulator